MPNNHRGNFIAPPHRPTPRLAQGLSGLGGGPSTPEEAQTALNTYRSQRDAGKNPSVGLIGSAAESYRTDRRNEKMENKYGSVDGREDYLFDHPDEPKKGY
jgi:hypothetical protein